MRNLEHGKNMEKGRVISNDHDMVNGFVKKRGVTKKINGAR